MINEEIRDKEIRLIGSEGEQLGIVSSAEAQKLADEKNLGVLGSHAENNIRSRRGKRAFITL